MTAETPAYPVVRSRRQHAELVAELGMRIVGGTYEVGQVLPREEELTEELSVSRSVVREAMRVLAAKGLVESRPKRGTQVLPTGRWQHLDPDVLAWRVSRGATGKLLSDLIDLRAMIEPAACAHAAARATDTELALIASLARELAHAEDDEDAFIEADMRFHGALLAAAHNDLLNQVGFAIESALRLSRHVTVSVGHSARISEHIAVAEAVTARSAARARRAMASLIDLSAQDIGAILDSDPRPAEGLPVLIADGVHRVDCPLGDRVAALYLLAGPEAALLVDTGVRGSVPQVLLPYMRSRGLSPERVRYVLTTHCDFDHVGGAAEAMTAFPRALLLCHRLDQAMAEDVELTLARRYGEFVAAHGYDDTTAEGKAHIRSVTGTAPVDFALTGGERLRLAPDWQVEVLYTPGHSPGSVSVWDPRGQVLLIGDAVLGSGLLTRGGAPAFPPTYRGADAYRATIDRMTGMAITALGTAHYPLYRGEAAAEFLALSRAYTDRVETAVLSGLESAGRPLTTREIIQASRADLGPWDEATAMALMYPVVGHLELLAALGAVRADTTGPLTRWARTAR